MRCTTKIVSASVAALVAIVLSDGASAGKIAQHTMKVDHATTHGGVLTRHSANSMVLQDGVDMPFNLMQRQSSLVDITGPCEEVVGTANDLEMTLRVMRTAENGRILVLSGAQVRGAIMRSGFGDRVANKTEDFRIKDAVHPVPADGKFALGIRTDGAVFMCGKSINDCKDFEGHIMGIEITDARKSVLLETQTLHVEERRTIAASVGR